MKSSKEKRALIAGMIGCLLYVIGDFLFAATGKTQKHGIHRTDGQSRLSQYGHMAHGGQHYLRCSRNGTLLHRFSPDVEAPEAAPHPTKAAEVGRVCFISPISPARSAGAMSMLCLRTWR